jgi:hypothetical protein
MSTRPKYQLRPSHFLSNGSFGREVTYYYGEFGPSECGHDRLSYPVAFAVAALLLDLSSRASVREFAWWAALNSLGEDPMNSFVQFGARLHHCMVECDDESCGLDLVEAELPGLLPDCLPLASPYVCEEDR